MIIEQDKSNNEFGINKYSQGIMGRNANSKYKYEKFF